MARKGEATAKAVAPPAGGAPAPSGRDPNRPKILMTDLQNLGCPNGSCSGQSLEKEIPPFLAFAPPSSKYGPGAVPVGQTEEQNKQGC